ncbi:peptidase inhibitor family I36 protein [Streptomyces sp. NPDC086023]|uniref:peptidase inhibitor family I36 protein n=1 Tax=Streptomyces sp. NPDC086023 TaxID=3365746 RepID=UPI0037D67409
MRTRVLGVLAATAAFAGVMATAPSASAEGDPPGCPKGYFCAYSGYDQSGTLLLKTWGNWSGWIPNVKSTFNNGLPDAGADHVDQSYRWRTGAYTACMHYNPGPGEYKANWDNITLTGVRWRGEC